MKNLKWVKVDKNYVLKNDEITLVNLSISPANGSSFSIGNKKYEIERKGFWKSVYRVTSNYEEILTLSDSFFGKNGKIVFTDGTTYTINYIMKGGLRMYFMHAETVLLSYATTIENKQHVFTFSLEKSALEEKKLLVLSAVGMVHFTTSFGDDGSGGDAGLMVTVAAIA